METSRIEDVELCEGLRGLWPERREPSPSSATSIICHVERSFIGCKSRIYLLHDNFLRRSTCLASFPQAPNQRDGEFSCSWGSSPLHSVDEEESLGWCLRIIETDSTTRGTPFATWKGRIER